MKITYDDKIDAMYISLNEKASYKSSKKITKDLLVDYSADGHVIGLEVLDASKNSPMPKKLTSVPVEHKSTI